MRFIFVTFVVASVSPVTVLPGCGPSGAPPPNASGFKAGGFVEKANSTAVRDRVTPAQTLDFPKRGRFRFPSPYNTEAVRITNASDCVNGSDCVEPVGYSYWRNNNHMGSDTMYIFPGLRKTADGDGKGPTLFTYNKRTDAVQNPRPIFNDSDPSDPTYPYRHLSWDSGQGWYFSATQATQLYIDDGPTMLRRDVLSKTFETVFDATVPFGPGKVIWQMHSSNDSISDALDTVHSAALRCVSVGCTDGSHTAQSEFEIMGCLVYNEGKAQFTYYPRKGELPELDECQIDQSGRWVLMLEDLNGDGNLDVTGQYFIWTDNMAGDDGTKRDRLDAFLVKIPYQCLYRTAQREGSCDS